MKYIFYILIILFLIILIFSFKKIKDFIHLNTLDYLKANPDIALDLYYETNAIKSYKCTLFLTIQEESAFDGRVYDFSQYETDNIISLIDCRPTRSERQQFTDEDGNPITGILKDQIVYLMKDGSYEWDVRKILKELD